MKHDLLRLEDKYGRAQKGYEGAEGMTADLTSMRFFPAKNQNQLKDMHGMKICFKKSINSKNLGKLATNSSTLVALLSGSIKAKTGERMYFPTNIVAAEELRDSDYVFNNVSALIIGRGSL